MSEVIEVVFFFGFAVVAATRSEKQLASNSACLQNNAHKILTGWWFGTFFIFLYNWE